MSLTEQIQSLIAGAPDFESQMSVAAIAPTLQRIAQTLPRQTYYICQSAEGDWVTTVLRHRQQLELEIKVIYAFNCVEDIDKLDLGAGLGHVAIEIPIIHLLFEIIALPEVDRLIFLNNSQNLNVGQEVCRQDLETSMIKDLQQQSPSLPPDVC